MTTLASSIFNGSSLFLQVTRTIIKSVMSLNFSQIQQLIAVLAALECFNIFIYYMTSLLFIR